MPNRQVQAAFDSPPDLRRWVTTVEGKLWELQGFSRSTFRMGACGSARFAGQASFQHIQPVSPGVRIQKRGR